MCNDFTNASRIVGEVARVLKKGGRFFSYNPGAGCWGDGIGQVIGKNTFKDAEHGPFAHTGVVRFTSEEDIQELYSPFRPLLVDYSIRSVDGREHEMAFWVISSEKR